MASILRKFTVPAPADQVWAKISDLDNVHTLMSFLVDASVDGDRRTCTTADGGRLEELILGVDDDLKRVGYAITGSPFGLTFHAASWQVMPDGDDASTFVWYTDVKPDAVAPTLEQVIDGEAPNLVAALAAR